MIFPNCAVESPIYLEQCYIIESVAGGLIMVLWVSIIAIGLKGGLLGARKFNGGTTTKTKTRPVWHAGSD